MNFALIMFLLLVLTGGIWALDWAFLRRRRVVAPVGAGSVTSEGPARPAPEPWWVEYSKSFFPVILVVFLLRSFLVEPFKIPSGSMLPTLLVGDFILVNKYTYGIRLPVINRKVLDMNSPQRGEVMVFRYPVNTSLDYIKRVVGLPGDEVVYRARRLIINGQEVPTKNMGEDTYYEGEITYRRVQRYSERLNAHEHAIYLSPETGPFAVSAVRTFPHRDNCAYNDDGFVCKVPPGHYFMMGDNRDSSDDSRYWGFVPEQNIVGKAFLIWWNFDDFRRIGRAIQ
jgi:signal peptidase I